MEAILGVNFLDLYGCVIHMGQRKISFPSSRITFPLIGKSNQDGPDSEILWLILAEKLTIPEGSEIEVMSTPSSDFTQGKVWLIESEQYRQSCVMVTRAVVSPRNKEIPIRLLNPRKEPIELSKGIRVAQD